MLTVVRAAAMIFLESRIAALGRRHLIAFALDPAMLDQRSQGGQVVQPQRFDLDAVADQILQRAVLITLSSFGFLLLDDPRDQADHVIQELLLCL